MTDEREGTILTRVSGGLIVRIPRDQGATVARVDYSAPTAVAPGDRVRLTGQGGQLQVLGVRRG